MTWLPISDLDHPIVDDSPITMPSGRLCPALYESAKVLLTDGVEVWLGRSMIIGGARVRWGRDTFPTHFMPLPAPPGKEATDA